MKGWIFLGCKWSIVNELYMPTIKWSWDRNSKDSNITRLIDLHQHHSGQYCGQNLSKHKINTTTSLAEQQ